MITITQSIFETHVPAFRDVESRTFEAILPTIQRVLENTYEHLSIPEDEHLSEVVSAYVSLKAAYDVLPQLDLVLTENGFAVVSNTNLAPASRDRVASLQERLRKDKSIAYDKLLMALMDIPTWKDANGSRWLSRSLLWCPTLMRFYGVVSPNGKQVFEEEFRQLFSDMMAAQSTVSRLISFEQMQWLLQNQTHLDRHDRRYELMEHCRSLLSALIMEKRIEVQRLTGLVQHILNTYADELPEYRASSKYEADQFKPYENKREDPCFFFG